MVFVVVFPEPFLVSIGFTWRSWRSTQVTRALLAEGLADELHGDAKNILVGGHSRLVKLGGLPYSVTIQP